MAVTIKYADALSMFTAIGSSRAQSWDATKMAAQLQRLPSIVDADSTEVKALTGTDAKTFDAVVDAVEKGEEIAVTAEPELSQEPSDDVAEATPKKKSAKAKSQKSQAAKTPVKKEKQVTTATKKSKTSKGHKPSKKAAHSRGELGHTKKDKALTKFLAKPTISADALRKAVGEEITLGTARSWLAGWGKGHGLPTSAADKMDQVKAAIKKRKAAKREAVSAE